MFTLPPLPYAYTALEPIIDEQTMHIHHEKHHATYVKNLNDALLGHDAYLSMDIATVLTKINELPEPIRMKVRNNGGGHANHSLFWESMTTPVSGRIPSGSISAAIDKSFGDFATFTEQFSQAGMGRFGSGWVWLVKADATVAIMSTPNQDSPVMEGKIPLLGLDVWEHAYYLKYQNRRADYMKAWWDVVNWDSVEKRFSTTT